MKNSISILAQDFLYISGRIYQSREGVKTLSSYLDIFILKTCENHNAKVRSFSEHICAILSSLKIMIIFNNTSAEIKTKSTIIENDHNFEKTEERANVF